MVFLPFPPGGEGDIRLVLFVAKNYVRKEKRFHGE